MAVAWVGNFLYFRAFGLYEDDWFFLLQPYEIQTRYWLGGMWWGVKTFLLGRPFQILFVDAFALLGAKCGSLALLYVCGAILYSVSVALLYVALRHRFPASFAFLASLLFALSPLTSIRQLLHAVLSVAPGFIFLFLAFILYSRRRNAWSYVLAITALLLYEPIFLGFIAAPFLRKGRKRFKDIAVHTGIFCLILAAFIVVRLRTLEPRAATAITGSMSNTVWKLIQFDVFHVFSSFLSYVYATYVSFREPSWDVFFWTIGLLIPVLIVLFRCKSMAPSGGATRMAAARRLWWLWNAIVPGVIFLFASYALSYWHLTHELVYPLNGRNTRVSVGGAFASSILVAALFSFLLMIVTAQWSKNLIRGSIALLLIVLFMYSFVVQIDYINEWEHERSLLTQLIMLTPDVTQDTLLIVRQTSIPEALFPGERRSPSINTQTHGLSVSTSTLFEHLSGPKIFFPRSDDWKRYVTAASDGRLFWTRESFPGGWGRETNTPFGRSVIVFSEQDNGTLKRTDTPVMLGSRQINLALPADAGNSGRPSNWNRFSQSPFIANVLPLYVFTETAVNVVGRPYDIRTSVAPEAGAGRSQQFVATVSDKNGTEGIEGVFLMVQTSVEPKHSCWVYFDRSNQSLYLAQDNGSTWFQPIALGSSSSLSNGQCTVSGQGGKYVSQQREFKVVVPINFRPEFKGSKKLLLFVKRADDRDYKAGWQEKGSWLIP